MPNVGRITTHRADALGRLLQQSKNRPNITGVVGAFADAVQGLEDLAYPVLSGRQLNQAVGAQLDGIGELVGQARDGQDDATYRLFLAGRIYANNSAADTETIIALVTQVFGAKSVQVISPFSAGHAHRKAPAVLGIEVGSPSIATSLYPSAIQVLRDSLAAAVRISFVSVYDVAQSFAVNGPLAGSGLDGAKDAMGMATLIFSDAGA